MQKYLKIKTLFYNKKSTCYNCPENDSLYIHSDTLMVTGPAEHRITSAFRNVKLFKSDLSGKADSVHIRSKFWINKND